MQLPSAKITREQLVNFVLNDVNEEERKKISEAITANPKIKERYLFEKRMYDVRRYLTYGMSLGECCEIEELIKTDSRLYDYFESNTEAAEEETNEEEQDASINVEHLGIIREQLVNFILNDDNEEYIGQYEKISKLINTNPVIKDIYLSEKRKYDVERYLNNEMDFGERCEMEELLKIDLSLYKYFELKKDLIEEQENILINLMYPSVTKKQLVNFVLNDVTGEERKNIIEAININLVIKERYLFEKRKYDVERYIDDEMTIGERCEMEQLLKKDSRLFIYFELNNGVIEEQQDVTINGKHITITEEQLFNFVLNNVNEKEHKKISEAINTNLEIKERYLFKKRKYDVERYINDEMNIGECCEIEELIKMESRLSEHFELKKDANKEEQNISINLMNTSITKAQLVNFIFNNVTKEERKNIIEAINTNPEIKDRYLFEKRKFDVERYIYDEIDIGERCEIEQLLKKDSRLSEHFKLKIELINKEGQNVSISGKQIDITKEQLINFVLNDVTEKEHKKVIEAINTNPEIKERYLFEKRKFDVERLIDDEVDFGEACEIEELLKTDSRLFEYFELNKDVNVFILTNFIKHINDVHARIYKAIHNNKSGKVSSKETAPVIEFKFNVMKWVAAASIIFMIGFGGRNIYLNNTISLENRLYAKYFEPFNNDDDHYYSNSVLFDAKKRYSNKEYDLVLSLLDDFSNSVTIEFEKVLYQGLALMELKRYDEAIEKFKQNENNNKYKLTQSVNNWYLSLCYLKTGKKELAIKQLEKITDFKESPNFYKEANELLKKLNK